MAYGSSSPRRVRSRKSVTPASTRSRTSAAASPAPIAHGCRPAISRPGSITVGGSTGPVCRYPVRVARLIRLAPGADSEGMAPLDMTSAELRDRALTLATDHAVDPGAWYVRVLEEERKAGVEPDLGALVRVYWELQRV